MHSEPLSAQAILSNYSQCMDMWIVFSLRFACFRHSDIIVNEALSFIHNHKISLPVSVSNQKLVLKTAPPIYLSANQMSPYTLVYPIMELQSSTYYFITHLHI